MMRALAVFLALWLLSAFPPPVHGQLCAGPVGSDGCGTPCPATVTVPWEANSPAGIPTSAVAVAGSIGQVRCARFLMGCDGPFSKLAVRVTNGGGAGTQCAVAIYDLPGTRLLDSGTIDCAATNDKVVPGLPSAQLVAGAEYWGCFAASVTATMTYLAVGSVATLWNSFQPYQATAANVAQFNDACTASVTPYACCTGSKTGTCTGMPAALGTMTGATIFAPAIVMSN